MDVERHQGHRVQLHRLCTSSSPCKCSAPQNQPPRTREVGFYGDRCPIPSPGFPIPWPPHLSQALTSPQQALSGGFCPQACRMAPFIGSQPTLWRCMIPKDGPAAVGNASHAVIWEARPAGPEAPIREHGCWPVGARWAGCGGTLALLLSSIAARARGPEGETSGLCRCDQPGTAREARSPPRFLCPRGPPGRPPTCWFPSSSSHGKGGCQPRVEGVVGGRGELGAPQGQDVSDVLDTDRGIPVLSVVPAEGRSREAWRFRAHAQADQRFLAVWIRAGRVGILDDSPLTRCHE